MKKEKKKEKMLVCTTYIKKLYYELIIVERLFDKEVSKKFFRDKEFIKELVSMVAQKKANLWSEIAREFPETNSDMPWTCNGNVIYPKE